MELKLQPKKERARTLSLFLDGLFWRDVDMTLFGRNPPLPLSGSPSELESAFFDLEYKKAKAYVLKRLNRKSETTHDLTQALKQRLISPETTQRLLQELFQLGVLDDERWLRSFVDYQRRRHIGPQLIAKKLHAKGFSQETISRALHSMDDNSESLQELIEKRFRFKDRNNAKEVQKAIAYLCRKGYPLEEVLLKLKDPE